MAKFKIECIYDDRNVVEGLVPSSNIYDSCINDYVDAENEQCAMSCALSLMAEDIIEQGFKPLINEQDNAIDNEIIVLNDDGEIDGRFCKFTITKVKYSQDDLKNLFSNYSTEQLNEVVSIIYSYCPRNCYNYWEEMENINEYENAEEIKYAEEHYNFSSKDKYFRYDNINHLESTNEPLLNVNIDRLIEDILSIQEEYL